MKKTPVLIAQLRHCGLDVPCERVPDLKRGGSTNKRSVP